MLSIPTLRRFISRQLNMYCPDLLASTRLAGKDDDGRQIILIRWQGELGRDFFTVLDTIQALEPGVRIMHRQYI
jgi:hypothetical protein